MKIQIQKVNVKMTIPVVHGVIATIMFFTSRETFEKRKKSLDRKVQVKTRLEKRYLDRYQYQVSL